MTNGTQSAPCRQVNYVYNSGDRFGLELERLLSDLGFCPLVFGSSQMIASKRQSRPACSHEFL